MSSRLMEMIESRSKRQLSDDADSLKVSSHWKLIKAAIQQKEDADPKKLDKKQPLIVGHGVHPFTSIPSDKDLEVVVLNTFNENYAGVDSDGKVTVFLSTGYTQSMSKNLSRPLCGIVYAAKANQFVGWGNDETLMLLSESFRIISTASSVSKITSAIYNQSSNEVITGGAGNVTCWSFRYGAKIILQRKVFTEELPKSCQISCICLEDTSSRTQKCFAAYDRSVIAYTLLDGSCAAHYKDMHTREITSLLFFNPLKFLVSAARDGSIKVWDSQGNIKIIFVGHLSSVNTIAVYPFGPYILSGSSDCTIRVWSLETADEVDRINTKQPVKGLGTIVNNNKLYSFGANSVDLWKIEHVHSIFTTVGSTVKSIKTTTHPRMPVRMVCSCIDATVRLISPGSGECVTTLLVPDMMSVLDVVYAAGEGLLFALLTNGKILKASTMTNPCEILGLWSKEQTAVPSVCTCLCLYEYVVEDKLKGDSWSDLVTTLKAKAKTEELEGSQSRQTNNAYDRTLLLGGCVDGSIVVYDWQSKKTPGRVSFQIEAHREEVVTMTASPTNDQVISAGLDNTVKIWRLFPFAQEALAPLMTLFCQETPRHLSVAHHRLCVAFHEPATASYNIEVFKTTQKERYDHNSDQDHTDDITGLASCYKMRLFASCSADGSIRIWDESNKLMRVIKLNATPTSLCFSSEKGDLIVSIGKHLHKIGYAMYMPQSYIFRMVAMDFRRVVAEHPLPVEEDVHDSLSSSEKQRLVSVKSSKYKFSHFSDVLSHDEMEEKAEEEDRRQKAFAKIQERENELRKLRDGVFDFNRKRPAIDTEAVRGKAFERYLDIFYKKPAVQIPDEDELEEDLGPKYEEEDVYSPERGRVGFFSISRQSTRSRKSQPSPAKLVKPELLSRSPVRPVIPEIMSLSLPEFEPVKPLDELEKHDPVETDYARSESPDERPFSAESKSERRTISRVSTSAPSGDFRSLPLEPPLLNRHRYVIDVPKSNRYPSSGMCRHMVAQRVSRMASESLPDDDEENFVIAPDGYIPNSVVVALFKDFREEPKEEEGDVPWKPPQLTAEQLAELQKRKKKHPKSPVDEPTLKRKDSKQSKFAEQMRLALREVPSPEPLEELDIYKSPTPTPPPTPPRVDPSPEKTPSPKPKKEVKPLRPIEKLVSRPKIPTPPPLRTLSGVQVSSHDFHTEKVGTERPLTSSFVYGVDYDSLPTEQVEDNIGRQLTSNRRTLNGTERTNYDLITREQIQDNVSNLVDSGESLKIAPLCSCEECVRLHTQETSKEELKKKNYEAYIDLVSKEVEEQESPTPPKEPTPTPTPPPPTPLPDFIMQFSGIPWFEKVFPNIRPETFPKPWTVSAFVEFILSYLPRFQDFDLKSQICAAIMLLNRQEVLERECAEQVKRTLLAELNVPRPPTSHGSPEEARFVRVDIQLLQAIKIFDLTFVAELMAQYIDGDEQMRSFVEEILVSIGVKDRRGYFLKELDSFDIWDIPDNKKKLKIKAMCVQWLQKWLEQFKDHIRSLAGKISRAQSGSVVKGTKQPNTPNSIKGILKKDQQSQANTPSGRLPNVSFTIESLGGVAADSATPVEAINYFCEMKIEEELEKARARARVKTPAPAQDNSRNTVLILPKIHSKRSLARLGETHCSHCHPERETSLALAFPLPPIYQTKRGAALNNMALHLNTLTLNPFPEDEDLQVYEAAKHSSLITLRTSQKYFFPAQSLANNSDELEF